MEDLITAPAPRCEAHEGAHALYDGHCYGFGQQVPRPLVFARTAHPCDACGRRVLTAIVRASTQRLVLDAADGSEHECSPVPRVALDQDALAAGIATALHGLMEERRRARGTSPPQTPTPPPTRTTSAPQAPQERTVPAVTVYAEGGTADDGGA